VTRDRQLTDVYKLVIGSTSVLLGRMSLYHLSLCVTMEGWAFRVCASACSHPCCCLVSHYNATDVRLDFVFAADNNDQFGQIRLYGNQRKLLC
jgi:hypothetical protein